MTGFSSSAFGTPSRPARKTKSCFRKIKSRLGKSAGSTCSASLCRKKAKKRPVAVPSAFSYGKDKHKNREMQMLIHIH